MAGSTIGTYQHRLPASIIGGFGDRRSGARLRDATVQVTHLASGRSFLQKASRVGGETGAFDFVNRDATADTLWNDVEQHLQPALDTLVNARPLAEHATATDVELSEPDKAALSHAADIVRTYAVQTEVRCALFDEVQRCKGLHRDAIQQLRHDLAPQLQAQATTGDRDLAILTPVSSRCPPAIVDEWGYTDLVGAEHGRLLPVRSDLVLFFRSPETSPPDAAVAWGDLDDFVQDVRRAMTRPAPHGSPPRRFVFARPDDALTDVLPRYQPPRPRR